MKWLSRTLLLGPYLTLVTSEKEFRRALKHLNVEDDTPYVRPGWQACTHTYVQKNGNVACVVALDVEQVGGSDPVDIAALLVHEAVHVWQAIEDTAGDRRNMFGTEGPAYGIQNISAFLMHEYKDRITQ